MKPGEKKYPGCVYLIGAGPGDPGLLTLRGLEILKRGEIVFYDHLVNQEILKFCPQAQIIYVGKIGHEDSIPQDQIEKKLLEAVRNFRVVVRLKGGDPFIFGRGGEEAEFLAKSGIDFEVIPGVTSASAVPTYAGIPLTHRDLASSVTLVTGHEDPQKGGKEEEAPALNWSGLAAEKTLVLLMGVKNLGENFEKLMEHGMAPKTPAAIIEWGTYPFQRTVVGNLQSLPELADKAGIQAPSVVVVGEVVRLREKLTWFEKRPLFGRKILVTRPKQQAGELSHRLKELGAQVLEFSTLKVSPPNNWKSVDRAVAKLGEYDWILFSSVNAVEFFFKRLKELKKDIRSLGKAKILAVGPVTAGRLQQLGLMVERHLEEYSTDAMAKSLNTEEIRGKKILFPRADRARANIIQDLAQRGAEMEVAPVYQTHTPQYSPEEISYIFEKTQPDLLTFASGSTVKNFTALLGEADLLKQVKKIPAIVIGPVTREAAEQLGFKVVAMPKDYTIDGMVEEIRGYFFNLTEGFRSL